MNEKANHYEASRRVDVDRLRWTCDPNVFSFVTTEGIPPVSSVVGQDAAGEALRFGLKCRAHGQNVFVRGPSGTGRMTLVRRLLEEIQPTCVLTSDCAYVHNFQDPMRPRLIRLPRGQATRFAAEVDRFVTFIESDLVEAAQSETARARIKAVDRATDAEVSNATTPMEEKLARDNLALVTVTTGRMVRPAILPLVDGKPVPVEMLAAETSTASVTDEEIQNITKKIESYREDVDHLESKIREILLAHVEARRRLIEEEVRSALEPMCRSIVAQFSEPTIAEFLEALVADLIEHNLNRMGDERVSLEYYRVNPVLTHDESTSCPIVVENSPSIANLFGGIDRRVVEGELVIPDHMSIRKGSLLEADGGFLILEAKDLVSEEGAWRALVRTLRQNRLEIAPADLPWASNAALLKPEPIRVNVKVVLLGDSELFYLLDQLDQDFGRLFKVVADFDSVIPRSDASFLHYASVIRRIADEDDLPPFSCAAVAALIEHGARVAASRGKLTARFGRIADIAREAAFLTGEDARGVVEVDDVRSTVARTKKRAGLNSRRFRELLADGTIRVDTVGSVVGQVNGLAVLHHGPLTYGFPARITASIGPGSAGVVNIERESSLSGAIHTKSFLILSGLLRNLLESECPLTFEAAIAFEQSYGGIDGDSASAAEISCLMSALARVAIRQDLAMTGAIDQIGHVQAVGGVNEKIEGFFDTCNDRELTGTQGVIIPESNVGDLMLRLDVVEAAREGRFHVYSAGTIGEAMELLMGRPLHGDGSESLISLARARCREFWRLAQRKSDS